jgi:lysophospholipase L1-like esterase
MLIDVVFAIAQKRFKDEVFQQIDSLKDISYGKAINIKGENEILLLDVFMPPKIDTIKHRPLVIFIHGGGFQNNTKTTTYGSMLCNLFAKRGFVSATINYRLGVENSGIIGDKKIKTNNDFAEAMYRAQQDGKAAIRFFRKYAENYGIDTAQIFIAGSSAGAMIGMSIAYMNELEVPKSIDVNKWGSLEGSSGNEGFSSKVAGVMNAWGSMIDYNWIQKEDVPLFNTAGINDDTVPYDSSFDYHGFKYGPVVLFEHCVSLGIPTGLRPFENAGHTLDGNRVKQDSCIKSMADWLFTQLKFKKGNDVGNVFRFENDINRFDSLNLVEVDNSNSIMFLGSSFVRKWDNIRKDLDYQDIIHRGFGGSNLMDVAYYIKRIVYPHHPKAIFIYVGNDITGKDQDKSPDQVLALFKYVVKIIRNKYPIVPITWLAISPSIKRWLVWDKITEVNSLLKNYTLTQNNLYFIDAGNNFLNQQGTPNEKYFASDKLHYNTEGYILWGKSISASVKAIVAKSQQ